MNLLSIKENRRKLLLIRHRKSSAVGIILSIFFWNLPTFLCFLPYFLGLPVPTFSLRFAGKPVEALYIWLTRRWSYITVEMKAMQAKSVKLAIWSLQALPSNNVMLCTEMALGKNLGILTNWWGYFISGWFVLHHKY